MPQPAGPWHRRGRPRPPGRILAFFLACLLAVADPAMEKPVPAEPTPEQVKAYVEHKADPVVGTWVAKHRQGDGDRAIPATPPDSSVAQEVARDEADAAGVLEGRVSLLEGHLADLRAALPALPAELHAAAGQLTAELSDRGLHEIVPLLVAFVGLGVAAELLFVWASSGIVRRFEAIPATSVGSRARVALTRLLFGLVRALCFAVGSIGGFLLFTWPPNLRHVVLGYLGAILVLRLALAVGRVLFAPGEPGWRVLPISEPQAEGWQLWGAAFVGWYAFGYVTIQQLRGLGMGFAGSQLLAYLLGLGVLAIGLRLVWRPGGATPGRLIGTAVTILIWGAWVAGAKSLM